MKLTITLTKQQQTAAKRLKMIHTGNEDPYVVCCSDGRGR